MKLLSVLVGLFWYVLLHAIPHFRTEYYVRFKDETGQKFIAYFDSPDDVDARLRPYLQAVSVLCFLGRPFFIRHIRVPT